MGKNQPAANVTEPLRKSPTGIQGLDEITGGGLPSGRATLVCGGPGCGKTILAMEFLVRGIQQYDDPGLFVSFEESQDDLIENFNSFGFDLKALIAAKRLHISRIQIVPSEIVEAGDFSLDALFIRIQQAISVVGAKRVALDSIESIFTNLPNPKLLRSELARLLSLLKEQGITIILTGEKGEGTLTRNGFEEYVSDCVVTLDHRVTEQLSRRRLRFVKYRGSAHGADEHPFLIGATGLSVLPITSMGLAHNVDTDRISSGVRGLDAMMGGHGFYRGSSVLVSGTAGTGKSTLATHFAAGACGHGKRCLYLTSEESVSQIVRNMRSVGLDLQPWLDKGLLRIEASRATFCGIEERLVSVFNLVTSMRPDVFIMDPLSGYIGMGLPSEVRSMVVRMIDHLKMLGVTGLFTDLTRGSKHDDESEANISSLMDTWVALRVDRTLQKRRCMLYIVKSRGMEHSHETREMVFTSTGVEIRPWKKRAVASGAHATGRKETL